MSHISERAFVDDFVVAWLERFFSQGAIEKEYTLPSRRRVDLLVQTPFGDVAIEAENDAHSFDIGAGQALGYAEEVRRDLGGEVTPVLVVPLDPANPDAHRERPEFGIAKAILQDAGGDVFEVRAPSPDA